jgi:hypothetical protein
MSESKVFMFPDGQQGCNRGNNLDPNLLFAMMNNNGGFGGNGSWMWIIFLFFLYPLLRNFGFGGYGNDGSNGGLGSLGNLINNDNGRELLMQAVNRNGDAIQSLATMFNTSATNILQAINGVNSAISNVGCKVDYTSAQVINALQQGNMNIAQQLCNCCCDIRQAITNGNYQNQLATERLSNSVTQQINGVNVGLERGFSETNYALRDQTCQLGQAISGQTQTILARLDAMEKAGMQNKIDALQEDKSTLRTQLNLEHQNVVTGQQIAGAIAPVNAALAAIQKEVDAIKCAQPSTVTTPYQPFVAVPNCVAAQYGLGGVYGTGNGFWF